MVISAAMCVALSFTDFTVNNVIFRFPSQSSSKQGLLILLKCILKHILTGYIAWILETYFFLGRSSNNPCFEMLKQRLSKVWLCRTSASERSQRNLGVVWGAKGINTNAFLNFPPPAAHPLPLETLFQRKGGRLFSLLNLSANFHFLKWNQIVITVPFPGLIQGIFPKLRQY